MALRQCESYFIVALFYSDGQRICIQEYICLCGTVWTWRLQGKICVILKSNCGQILASLSLSDSYFEGFFFSTFNQNSVGMGEIFLTFMCTA